MFTNLIESQSHLKEFKRRSSFFLITVAAYVVILFAAGVASIYAYDAQLEAQTSSLELLNWVPPVTANVPKPQLERSQPAPRRTTSNASVDRHVDVPIRTQAIASTNDPTKVPENVGIKAPSIPPVTGRFRLGNQNVNPLPTSTNGSGNCLTCPNTPVIVVIPEKPPEPPVVKPPTTQRISSVVLTSKAISLPQPPYPVMAKQTRTEGVVGVQILVDEQGRVISAQAVSGSPLLTAAAKDAAMRARFTPTKLNGVPVKVQGVITYNFVMQ